VTLPVGAPARVGTVAFAPSTPSRSTRTAFTSRPTAGGAAAQHDGGASWAAAAFEGRVSPTPWRGPRRPEVLYAGFGVGSHRRREQEHDAGATWADASAGLPWGDPCDPTPCLDEVFSLTIHPRGRTAVGDHRYHEPYVSEDGGGSWHASGAPVSGFAPVALVPDRPDAVIVADSDGAWLSEDGGATWSPLARLSSPPRTCSPWPPAPPATSSTPALRLAPPPPAAATRRPAGRRGP